jgi:trans-aconitate 2-methyltransferase
MHKWDPADYEKSSSAQYEWAMKLISLLKVAEDERILDIGCGDGRITARLAALVPKGEVFGIDLSPDMVDFARGRFPRESYPNLSFSPGDASALDFHEEFGLVVSFACLHWVKDHLPVLKGIRCSLRSGGRILLQFGGRGNAAALLGVTEELTKSEKWSDYFKGFQFPYNFYGPEEYRIWLAQAGLRCNRVELVEKDMVHRGKAGLEGIVRVTWLPYLEQLPESCREEFVEEVARRYLERYPLDGQGRAHVRMMRLEVEAEAERPS